MTLYVLDTNIITALLNAHLLASQQLRTLDRLTDRVYLCPFVYFEVVRGLRAKQATTKLAVAEALFSTFTWHDFTRADFTLASDLWVQHRHAGKPISDADLLIGVFALNRNATLVTQNTKDFSAIGVSLADWIQL